MTPVMLEMYVSVTHDMYLFFSPCCLSCSVIQSHPAVHCAYMFWRDSSYQEDQFVACEFTNYFLAISKSDGSNY